MSERAEVEAALLECYAWTRSLALMLARNGFEADDLVQEAFARALRSPPQTVNAAAVRAWLRTTMVRDLIRNRGRAARELKAFGRLFLQPPPVPATTQAGDDLQRALRRLPPRQRAVIVLRYVHDLPEDEIAEALGVAAGTVKAHLAQARQKLRGIIGED